MQELIVNIAPNLASKLPDFYKALGDTMLMVLWSGLISFVFGLLLGVVLTVTKPNGILENKVVYQILDKLVSRRMAVDAVSSLEASQVKI